MAEEGGVEMLVRLLAVKSDTVQRQAAKALANLGVHKKNKVLIAEKGAVGPLIALVESGPVGVQIEAVAALANLAVNGETVHPMASRPGAVLRRDPAWRELPSTLGTALLWQQPVPPAPQPSRSIARCNNHALLTSPPSSSPGTPTHFPVLPSAHRPQRGSHC